MLGHVVSVVDRLDRLPTEKNYCFSQKISDIFMFVYRAAAQQTQMLQWKMLARRQVTFAADREHCCSLCSLPCGIFFLCDSNQVNPLCMNTEENSSSVLFVGFFKSFCTFLGSEGLPNFSYLSIITYYYKKDENIKSKIPNFIFKKYFKGPVWNI